MTTGQLIKDARRQAGLTQKELGEKLGITYQTIAQWENNLRNPKYETLKRIAVALGVEWTDLVLEDQQGATIVAHVVEKADLTVKDKNGSVIHQGDGRPWEKMSDAEAYRAGFLRFRSDEDRIAFFYLHLNTDGKLAAGGFFFRYLDKDILGEAADYVMSLSENPLYQRRDTTDTTPAEPPPESTENGG